MSEEENAKRAEQMRRPSGHPVKGEVVYEQFPVSDSDDDEASYSPSQYLEDEDANPADIFAKDSLDETNTSQLYEAINQLDDRSRDILQDRWLADEKLTLHELAEKYDISAERVRQIEKYAMKKEKQSFSAGE